MKFVLLLLLCLTTTWSQHSSSTNSTAIVQGSKLTENDFEPSPAKPTAKQVPNHNKPYSQQTSSSKLPSLTKTNQDSKSLKNANDLESKTVTKQQSTVSHTKDEEKHQREEEKTKSELSKSKQQSNIKEKNEEKEEKSERNNAHDFKFQVNDDQKNNKTEKKYSEESKLKESNYKASSPEIVKGETDKEKIQKNIQAKKIGGAISKQEEKKQEEMENKYSQQHFQIEKQTNNTKISQQIDKEKSRLKVEPPKTDQKEQQEETIVIKPASVKSSQKEEIVQSQPILQEKVEKQKGAEESKKESKADETETIKEKSPEVSKQQIETSVPVVPNDSKTNNQQKQTDKDQIKVEEDKQKESKIKIIPLDNEPSLPTNNEGNKQQIQTERAQPPTQQTNHGQEQLGQDHVLPPPSQTSKKQEKSKEATEGISKKEKQQPKRPESERDSSGPHDEVKKIDTLVEQVKSIQGQLTSESKKEIIKYLEAAKTKEKDSLQAEPEDHLSEKTMLKLEKAPQSNPPQQSEEKEDKDREFINEQQMDTPTIVIIIILTFVISIPIFREIRRIEGEEPGKEEKQNLNISKERAEKESELRDETQMSYQSGFEIGQHLDQDYN